MPCMELFEKQSAEYKESVLPRKVSMMRLMLFNLRLQHFLCGVGFNLWMIALSQITARVSVEAATSFGWDRYLGFGGKHIGIDSFGASAPAPILYEKFGITKAHVVKAAKEVVAAAKK